MIFPTLTDAERMVLEEMAMHGPKRELAVPIRGRLALYKLIDETPNGWNITTFGRQALQAAPPAAAAAPAHKAGAHSGDSARH
ncbi:hypothetical protein BH10PSE6_BH10PSE6_18530 [soil metagenome]